MGRMEPLIIGLPMVLNKTDYSQNLLGIKESLNDFLKDSWGKCFFFLFPFFVSFLLLFLVIIFMLTICIKIFML
jgi:hypothetical protein